MRRLSLLALLPLLVLPAGAGATATAPGRITQLQVTAASFDSTLKHNIDNLTVTVNGQSAAASFLDYYNATGGLQRWGYPTSEVLQEEAGNLAQYYQRGVVDWHWRPDMGAYILERRLGWDYFGGDRSGGNDQGVEAGSLNPNGGEALGPWGHTVSDFAVDGTDTGFRKFFDRMGGVRSFGFPKSEARADTNADGTLHIPAATPGFIRQYFQAAVFEYHPGSADPVELRLLGDDLRDRDYPDEAWKSMLSFQPASPVAAGQFVGLESTVGTPVSAVAFQVNMPSSVQQGHAFQLEVLAPAGDTVSASLDGSPLHIFQDGAAWMAYVGFDPLAAAAAHTVSVSDGTDSVSGTFAVTPVKWPVETMITTPQQNAVSAGTNVADENNFLRPIFLSYTPKQLWSGPFSYPVTAPLTDGFGVFRSYNGGPANTYHEGRDLGANEGTPIHAPAAGRVVLARPLTVRGGAVLVDHGLGVFTGSYHQSKIAVQEGQLLSKGDLIGYVGDTGFANGPHLHWEMRIGNVYVDPDQWTRTAMGV
ncbi:MAG: M23 family metallopeptidase [Chloroflexota bacterium]|nr:M23 family metallopeptidase [Chloroflexota bacterium]